MGKRALVVLCTALVVAASIANTRAQEPPKPAPTPVAVKAGTFLTDEDLQYLDAALGYVNLTRDQLKYEKKQVPSTLRLKVCDRALDDPINVPRTAEEASHQFSPRTPAATRMQYAAELLDQPPARWDAAELQKDNHNEQARIAEYEKLRDDTTATAEQRTALAAKHAEQTVTEFFGGRAIRGHESPADEPDDSKAAAMDISEFLSVLGSLNRVAEGLTETDRRLLGGSVAEIVAETPLPMPGVEANNGQIFGIGSNIDIAAKLIAGCRLAAILETRAVAWQRLMKTRSAEDHSGKPSTAPGITGGILKCWQGPWGKFVIGGTGPNIYEGDDFIGIIDLGGDDIYRGRVASAIGLPGNSPISFVLDMGGNDRYEGEDFTQGFGFLGVGILHDLGGGNDTYRSRFCAQGCGLCGYGELFDDGGDDQYQADSGAQGAGVFGFGHLIDAKGNDVYRGCRYVQAFAQVMGVGVLTDGAGNDLYYAGGKYLHQPLWNDRYQSLSQGFAIGNRGEGTGGGVALLLDEGDGNDVYQADIYGQGSSYWYSLGMLVDRAGNDTYTLGQYGQGAGIHLSAGILVDLAGNDTYTNPFGVGTGGAHDWAVGWLIDRAGNDLYQGNGQGQGLNYAIGILLDCAGDDSHISNNELCVGKGVNNDISLLIDLGGTDVYGPKEIKDGEFTRRDKHAQVFDVPLGWSPSIDESTVPTVQDPPPKKVRVQHILIAWDGTGVDSQKAKRTKDQAKAIMERVLAKSRSKSADWKQLQTDYNEDSGDKPEDAHNIYDVEAGARLVKPFLDCSMKLGKGQVDVCESKYGYHIIKRLE